MYPRLMGRLGAAPELECVWPKGLLSLPPAGELVGIVLELASVVEVPSAGVPVVEPDGRVLGDAGEALAEGDEDGEALLLDEPPPELESALVDCEAKPTRAWSKSKTV